MTLRKKDSEISRVLAWILLDMFGRVTSLEMKTFLTLYFCLDWEHRIVNVNVVGLRTAWGSPRTS